MAENTKIEWADHTFNPWMGCTEVSPACDNCYARTLMQDRLMKVKWGAGQQRIQTGPASWRKPRVWNNSAAQTGERPRVFCASLADVFDAEVPDAWRFELFDLIAATPHLDWLLLTKRPQVAKNWFNKVMPITKEFRHRPFPEWPNVWLGTTVENQQTAEARIHHLLTTANVAKRFLSMEPLLEEIDLTPWLWGRSFDPCIGCAGNSDPDCECAAFPRADVAVELDLPDVVGIDWIIVGGEHAPRDKLRPMEPAWAQSLLDQVMQIGGFGTRPLFFMKQVSGTWKGELQDIPEELLIREIPE